MIDIRGSELRGIFLPAHILIVSENDELPKPGFIGFKRYDEIFIHKNNKYKEEFIELLEHCTVILGMRFGAIHEFDTLLDHGGGDINRMTKDEKATGRTTKLADYYIQELFNNPNKEIEITDHTDTQQSNVHLTQIILRRVYEEHRGVKIKLISPNILKYVQK